MRLRIYDSQNHFASEPPGFGVANSRCSSMVRKNVMENSVFLCEELQIKANVWTKTSSNASMRSQTGPELLYSSCVTSMAAPSSIGSQPVEIFHLNRLRSGIASMKNKWVSVFSTASVCSDIGNRKSLVTSGPASHDQRRLVLH